MKRREFLGGTAITLATAMVGGSGALAARRVPTIDSQVHVYERNHPGRPWKGALPGPTELTGDEMLAAMDSVGVNAAILTSSFILYQYDYSYALSVRNQHPDRFGVVTCLDVADPALAENVAEWARTPGAVGIRVMSFPKIMFEGREVVSPVSADADDPHVNKLFSEAARHSLPVNLTCAGRLDQAIALAAAHPNCRIVIDHMGLAQPAEPPAPKEPFRDLPKLLQMAKYDNVAVKVSGVCTLSHEQFPYRDIWEPLKRTVDAFGIDRCIWGSDWTRALKLLTYKESVDAFAKMDFLTPAERSALFGGSLQKIYRWSPKV